MFLIDQYAYVNKLSKVHPAEKILFSLLTMCIAIAAKAIAIHLVVFALMAAATLFLAGIPKKIYISLLLLPMSFIVIGIIPILIVTSYSDIGFIYSLKAFNLYFGVTNQGIASSTIIIARSMAAATCLYFIALTTPLTDILELLNIEYIRYSRRSAEAEGCIFVDSIESCAAFLLSIKGCVFFTTGIKNIKDYEKARGENRFIYRVLPSIFSIQECVDNNVKMEDIVAILGPISEELNYQMFKDFKADYVIMKDSGKEGGTTEKVQACKRLGITPVVIGRPAEEEGFNNIEELLKILL